jgi:hypothetical protein
MQPTAFGLSQMAHLAQLLVLGVDKEAQWSLMQLDRQKR